MSKQRDILSKSSAEMKIARQFYRIAVKGMNKAANSSKLPNVQVAAGYDENNGTQWYKVEVSIFTNKWNKCEVVVFHTHASVEYHIADCEKDIDYAEACDALVKWYNNFGIEVA